MAGAVRRRPATRSPAPPAASGPAIHCVQPGGPAFVARRKPVRVDLTVRRLHAPIDLRHGRDLAGCQAAIGRGAPARQRRRVEPAGTRIAHQSVLQAVRLVARREAGLRHQFDRRRRQERVRRRQHLLIHDRPAHLHRRAGGGVAANHAVEIVRVALHFHQRLAAAVRAALEVGILRRRAVERRGQRLGRHRADVRAAIAVVDFLGAIAGPIGLARAVAGVGGRGGIAARQSGIERGQGTAESADAEEQELPIPALRQIPV